MLYVFQLFNVASEDLELFLFRHGTRHRVLFFDFTFIMKAMRIMILKSLKGRVILLVHIFSFLMMLPFSQAPKTSIFVVQRNIEVLFDFNARDLRIERVWNGIYLT